ncbi:SIK2 [Symbiodinium natans]|uniref:SIK2 protein n=1 Tax=Symbiodinium natans TaxID=878477 RepID=A0A812GZ69_9DINO|nr:SIK2 [Symbiodinium natans]
MMRLPVFGMLRSRWAPQDEKGRSRITTLGAKEGGATYELKHARAVHELTTTSLLRTDWQDNDVAPALVVFDWVAAFCVFCFTFAWHSERATFVFCDEDDTILPTAALAGARKSWRGSHQWGPGFFAAQRLGGGQHELRDFDSYLEACGVAALQALQKAKRFGRVIIITNSGFGWVHETALRFMPMLLSQGELEDIPVISARAIFEPLGVLEPYRWKVLCFRRIVDCFTFDAAGKTGPSSLISIGDGWQEPRPQMREQQMHGWCSENEPRRVAAMMAAQDVNLSCVKCIKFLEQPGVDQLAQELDLCSQVFEGLVGHPSWVDACYSYTEAWGLQLEARAADTSALGGSFAAVQGTVEVVSTDTVRAFRTLVVGCDPSIHLHSLLRLRTQARSIAHGM